MQEAISEFIKSDIVSWVEKAGPAQLIEFQTSRCHLIGVSRGAKQNHFGEDALRISMIKNRGLKISIVDAISDRSKMPVRSGRIQAEIVAKELVLNSPKQALDNSEKRIQEENRIRSSQNLPLLESDPLTYPIAFAELHHLPQGPTLLQPMGTSDTAIICFVPNIDGQFTRDSIRIVYFNPLHDAYKDQVWGERYQGVRRKLRLPNPYLLPDGSMFLIASDGGLEALVNTDFLSALGILVDDGPERILARINSGKINSKDEYNDALTFVLIPLIQIFNSQDSLTMLKQLLRKIQSSRNDLDDDASIVIGRTRTLTLLRRLQLIRPFQTLKR